MLHLQREDGAWGGCENGPASIEETALALEALSGMGDEEGEDGADVQAAWDQGANWLLEEVESGAWKNPSPIGFYFAKLWYYEKLYPVIFATGALERLDTR